jgi:hypothetical protein
VNTEGIEMATCPVCHGTLRRPVDGDYNERWLPYIHGYDKDSHTFACNNCGGQTMSSKPTGRVPVRADGTPCRHDYLVRAKGRCLTEYTCRYCIHHFVIDSGD